MDKESSENKIDDLNKEAWEVRVSDSNRAHLLSGEAVKRAGETGDSARSRDSDRPQPRWEFQFLDDRKEGQREKR